MTTGLELVQWALWWMAEQRRQYILNMRKALYYMHRRTNIGRLMLGLPVKLLPGASRTPIYLTQPRREYDLAGWDLNGVTRLVTGEPHQPDTARGRLRGPGW